MKFTGKNFTFYIDCHICLHIKKLTSIFYKFPPSIDELIVCVLLTSIFFSYVLDLMYVKKKKEGRKKKRVISTTTTKNIPNKQKTKKHTHTRDNTFILLLASRRRKDVCEHSRQAENI